MMKLNNALLHMNADFLAMTIFVATEILHKLV